MKTKSWMLAGFTACLIVLDSGLVRAQRDNDEPPNSKYVGLTDAEAERLEQKVNGLVREAGIIESASSVDIRALTSGTIIELAAEGTKVKKGDRVGRLDSSSIEEAVNAQKVELANAKAKVIEAKNVAENCAIEFESARNVAAKQVDVAEMRFKAFGGKNGEFAVQAQDIAGQIVAAEKMRDARLLALQRIKEGDKADIAEVEAMLAQAAAELAMLQRKEKLQSVMKELRMAELALAITQQQAKLTTTTHGLKAKLVRAEAEVAVAQRGEDFEKNKLAALEGQLAAAVLIAPQDGLVIYPTVGRGQDPIEEGTNIRERQTVLQIADLSDIQAAVLVNETRIGRVRIGQKATIQMDAFIGQVFKGTVTHINRTPEPTTFLSDGSRKYKVTVTVEKPFPQVRIGMTALVDIQATK